MSIKDLCIDLSVRFINIYLPASAYFIYDMQSFFFNLRSVSNQTPAERSSLSLSLLTWIYLTYVWCELMAAVPAVFGVDGKLWAKMRRPSFVKCDINFYKMIDSSKLEEITNQFEGQQVNYVQVFSVSTSGNDVFSLKMIYIVFLYRGDVVRAESLTLCRFNDLPVIVSSQLTVAFMLQHFSMKVRTYEGHLKFFNLLSACFFCFWWNCTVLFQATWKQSSLTCWLTLNKTEFIIYTAWSVENHGAFTQSK